MIEYQDAQSFITYANSLYSAKLNAQSDRLIKDSMAQLTVAFKGAIAPQTPVKTQEEARQLVQTIAQTHQN